MRNIVFQALRVCGALAVLMASHTSLAGNAVVVGFFSQWPNQIYIPTCQTPVGTSKVCSAYVTSASSGAPFVLGNPGYSITGANASEVKVVPFVHPTARECSPGMTVKLGEPCYVAFEFTPTAQGERDASFVVHAAAGHVGTTWKMALIGDPPQDTYSWEVGSFSACEGGSGEWQLGVWAPAEGCGPTTQHRTNVCVVDSNSGLQTRSVVCKSSDGETVADSFCTDPKPATQQACTPPTAVCGIAPEDTRVVDLRNACPSKCIPDAANNKYCLMMPF